MDDENNKNIESNENLKVGIYDYSENEVKSSRKRINSKKLILFLVAICIILGVIYLIKSKEVVPSILGKVDDWQYSHSELDDYYSGASGSSNLSLSADGGGYGAGTQSIGFSAGGAKDINSFREDIKNGYTPAPTDISHEGLFYEYLFDTGQKDTCEKLFCPSYSTAVSKDPFSEKDEYFISVGLNSNIKQSDFSRKKLNLVVVMDISGSMSAPFDNYYYDRLSGNSIEEEFSDESKMDIANKAANELLGHLNGDDYFSMVLFDDQAYLAKPFRDVGSTNMDAIKGHILEIQPRGGTNMSEGMKMAVEQFKDLKTANNSDYDNRIIFITDAQPNQGDLTEEGMVGIAKVASLDNIGSTFIGVGLDFNTELVEKITRLRGANHYSVKSEEEFSKRMDEGFEYMVTPLVHDLVLTVDAPGFEIKKVYGSPSADESTGEIVKVSSLFPSESKDGETRGGLILLQLERKSNDNRIKISTSYSDREGKTDGQQQEFELNNSSEYFENTGIHKGVILSRYVNLLKSWSTAVRVLNSKDIIEQPELIEITQSQYVLGNGIPVIPTYPELGRWENQSTKLSVSPEYKDIFKTYLTYFDNNSAQIGDSNLTQESDLLKTLIAK